MVEPSKVGQNLFKMYVQIWVTGPTHWQGGWTVTQKTRTSTSSDQLSESCIIMLDIFFSANQTKSLDDLSRDSEMSEFVTIVTGSKSVFRWFKLLEIAKKAQFS